MNQVLLERIVILLADAVSNRNYPLPSRFHNASFPVTCTYLLHRSCYIRKLTWLDCKTYDLKLEDSLDGNISGLSPKSTTGRLIAIPGRRVDSTPFTDSGIELLSSPPSPPLSVLSYPSAEGDEIKAKDQTARDARILSNPQAKSFLKQSHSKSSLYDPRSQRHRAHSAMPARAINRRALDVGTGKMKDRAFFVADKNSDPTAHPRFPGLASLPKKRKHREEPVASSSQDSHVSKKQKRSEPPAVPGPSRPRDSRQKSLKKPKFAESPVIAGPSKPCGRAQRTKESEDQLIAGILKGATSPARINDSINRDAEPYQPPTYFLNQVGEPIGLQGPGLISPQSIQKLRNVIDFFGNASNQSPLPPAPIRYPSKGKMAGKFHTWEPDEDRLLLECVKKGMAQKTISNDFLRRRTVKSIQHRLAELRKMDRGDDGQLQLQLEFELRSDPIVTRSVTSQVEKSDGQQKLNFKRDKGKGRADGKPRGGGVYPADVATPIRPSKVATPKSCPQFNPATKAAVVIDVDLPSATQSASNRAKPFPSPFKHQTPPPVLPDDDIEDSPYTPGQQLRNEMQQFSQQENEADNASEDEFGFSQEDEEALLEYVAREESQTSSQTRNGHESSQRDFEETSGSADNPVILKSDAPSSDSDSDSEDEMPNSPLPATTSCSPRRLESRSYIDDEAEEVSDDEEDNASDHFDDENFNPPDEDDGEASEVSEEWSVKAFRKTPKSKSPLPAAKKAKSVGASTPSKPAKYALPSASGSSASSSSPESDSESESVKARQSGSGSGSGSGPKEESDSSLPKKTDSEDDLVKGLDRPVLDRTVSGRFKATQGQTLSNGKGKVPTHGPNAKGIKYPTEHQHASPGPRPGPGQTAGGNRAKGKGKQANIPTRLVEMFVDGEWKPEDQTNSGHIARSASRSRKKGSKVESTKGEYLATLVSSGKDVDLKSAEPSAKATIQHDDLPKSSTQSSDASIRVFRRNEFVPPDAFEMQTEETRPVVKPYDDSIVKHNAMIGKAIRALSAKHRREMASQKTIDRPRPSTQHRDPQTSPSSHRRVIGRSDFDLAKQLFSEDEEDEEDERADAKLADEEFAEDSAEEESAEDEPEQHHLKPSKPPVNNRIRQQETGQRASVSMRHSAELQGTGISGNNGSQAAAVGVVQCATHPANMRRASSNIQAGSPPSSESSQSQKRRQRRKRWKREVNGLPQKHKVVRAGKPKRRPGF